MMKKFVFIVLIPFIVSCNLGSYVIENKNKNIGVDFSKGKWLLNTIDCPTENKELTTSKSIEFFSNKLGDRFVYVADAKNLLLAQKSYFKASKSDLKNIKKGTNFDYLINIVANKTKEEIAGLQLYRKRTPGTNQSEIYIEIVDLNNQEVVYNEHIIGTFRKNTNPSVFDDETKRRSNKLGDNINTNTTSDALLKGCLNRMFRELNKY